MPCRQKVRSNVVPSLPVSVFDRECQKNLLLTGWCQGGRGVLGLQVEGLDQTQISPLTTPPCSQLKHSNPKGVAGGCGGPCGLWEVFAGVCLTWRDGEVGRHSVGEGEMGRGLLGRGSLGSLRQTLRQPLCWPGIGGLCTPAGLDPELHSSGKRAIWSTHETQALPAGSGDLCPAGRPECASWWGPDRDWREGTEPPLQPRRASSCSC